MAKLNPEQRKKIISIDYSTTYDKNNLWITGFSKKEFMKDIGLPVDPRNNTKSHYEYKTSKTPAEQYEINVTFESAKFKKQMQDDGGSDPKKFEVGNDLTLL